MSLSRRQMMLTAGAGAIFSMGISAIEPVPRIGQAKLKLGLAAYSFRQWLDLKKKPKPDWSLEKFIDFAAQQNCDAVELTSYYIPETTPTYLAAIKQQCSKLGLDVSGSAVGNNFCVTDPEKLKTEIASVKAWTDHTARLGGKTLRIFAGNVSKGDVEEKALARCIEAIQECCEHAAKTGVLLAIENHGGITATADQLLKIVTAVKHDSFGVNLDTGNFHTDDPYADLAKIAPYAVTVQLKTEVQAKGKPVQDADLKRLIAILTTANYRGYVNLEYEAKENALVAVPKHLAELKKLMFN